MSVLFYHPIGDDIQKSLRGCGASSLHQLANRIVRNTTTLDLDIVEHPSSYDISADLPGLGEEDVKLEIHNGILLIAAEKNVEIQSEDENGKSVTISRRTRSFKRSFPLPDDVDEQSITATMDKGVLSVRMPKRPKEAPRKIVISSTKSQAKETPLLDQVQH
jgi:HSP20 family protein